jgi:hypothetical protein
MPFHIQWVAVGTGITIAGALITATWKLSNFEATAVTFAQHQELQKQCQDVDFKLQTQIFDLQRALEQTRTRQQEIKKKQDQVLKKVFGLGDGPPDSGGDNP